MHVSNIPSAIKKMTVNEFFEKKKIVVACNQINRKNS